MPQLKMARVLEPFAPPGGTIQVDPGRNLILLAGLVFVIVNSMPN